MNIWGEKKSLESIPIFLIILIFLFLGITASLSYKLNIYIDEVYTLNSTDGNLFTTFNKSINHGNQAPLYFLIINLWRKINDSLFFTRLFSVICIISSIIILFNIIRYEIKKKYHLAASIILTFNPMIVWAAIEARGYALLVLLSASFIYSTLNGYFKGRCPRKERYRFLTIIVSILGIWTYFYFVINIIGILLLLIILGRWNDLKIFLKDTLIIVIFILPTILIVKHQVGFFFEREKQSIEVLYIIKTVMRSIEHIFFPFGEIPITRVQRWIIRFLFLGALFYLLKTDIKTYLNVKKPQNAYLYFFSVVSFLLTVVVIFLNKGILPPRHAMIVYVPGILFLISLISNSNNNYLKKSTLNAIIGLYFVVNIIAFIPMAKNGDYMHIAKYIMENEGEKQPIIVYQNEKALGLRYHYKGINKIVPIPKEISEDRYIINERIIHSENEIFLQINRFELNNKYLWAFIEPGNEFHNIEFNLPILIKYLTENYDVLSQRIFYKDIKVLFLEKKNVQN